VASNSSSTSSRGGTSGSSSKMSNLNVADVYDIAANIGKEFEVLIDSHGPEHVTPLMQKVISALEDLEKLAATRDLEKETIDSLKTTISHLEIEDTKKKEETQRNAKELEQIEEHYKQETRDLLSTVKRLQDENRKLASSLAKANERDSAFSEDGDVSTESYFEVELVNRLQTVVEKQRGNIKKVEQSNIEFKSDNEELRRQNEKLISCTRDLRRKLRTTQSQLHLLVDERAELTANVHDQQRELQQLQKQLGKATLECEELSQGSTSLKGKVVYDEKDPHRPRFSLPELRDILQERNALKARVSDLEDELAVFRPRPLTSSSVAASVASPSRLRLAASITASECDCSYHSRKDLDHDDS